MVVRIVTFRAASVEAARTWACESAHTFRSMPGAVPPPERLVESLQQARADGDAPVREEAYWVMDVIE